MRYQAVLVDMANLSHRVFHTAGDLTTQIAGKEESVGMVYGFIRSCVKQFEEIADRKGCAFILCDEDEATARKAMWPGYKAERPPHAPGFDRQRDLLRRIVDDIGWVRCHSPGWEADDVAATLAHTMSNSGWKVAIVTSDRDSHQCVTDLVHVVDPNAKKHDLQDGRAWRKRDVERSWGVPIERIPDVKALSGDGDEYPGAWRIGEIKATALIQEYGSLENVLAHALSKQKFEITLGDRRHLISSMSVEEQVDELRLFLDLATVRRDVDVEFFDPSRGLTVHDVMAKFRELRFASLTAPTTLASCVAMGQQ